MKKLNKNNDWKITPLAEVVDIFDSRRIPINSTERAKRSGDVPYYGATGQVGWIDDHLFDEELVLLGEDGAPFLDPAKPTAYLIQGKSWVNNHAHVLRGKPGLLNSFLLYQLNNLDYHPYVSGTTRLKLPQGPMKKIPLFVPSEDEQRRIVAEIEKQFTRLDAGVAALQRVQSKLKRYRASVLKSACEGRLVPTESELARAEGRDYESAKVLLQRILTERREKWNGRGKYKEPAAPDIANLPELPEGWVWTTLDLIADVKGGITKDAKRNHTSTSRFVPYLRVANVQRGYIDLSEVKEIEATEEIIKVLSLQRGDILFNEGGDRDKLGRGWVWNGELPECIHQNHVFRARVFAQGMNPKFVSWYGNTFGQQFFFDEGKHTTNLASISLTKLKCLPIPLPPLAEQERIVAEVERRISVVDELEATVTANLQRATRLRQAILQKTFTPGMLSESMR